MGLFRPRREPGLEPIEVVRPTVYEELGLPLGRPLPGPPQGDVTVSVTAAGLAGKRIAFTTLPDGDVLIDEEEGDADVSALADAVEKKLRSPYRALAVRQERDVWVVVANRIVVARIQFSGGDTLDLSRNESSDELQVDGRPSGEKIPELERLGSATSADFFVRAKRLEGDLWEVRVTAL